MTTKIDFFRNLASRRILKNTDSSRYRAVSLWTDKDKNVCPTASKADIIGVAGFR